MNLMKLAIKQYENRKLSSDSKQLLLDKANLIVNEIIKQWKTNDPNEISVNPLAKIVGWNDEHQNGLFDYIKGIEYKTIKMSNKLKYDDKVAFYTGFDNDENDDWSCDDEIEIPYKLLLIADDKIAATITKTYKSILKEFKNDNVNMIKECREYVANTTTVLKNFK